MRLPLPPGLQNVLTTLATWSRELRQADEMNHKKTEHLEIGREQRFIMRSPNGTRWEITVEDDGSLTTTDLT